jgi:hypothetical protein
MLTSERDSLHFSRGVGRSPRAHVPTNPTGLSILRLLYCMEYLEHHLGEALKLLRERLGIVSGQQMHHHSSRAYLLFDLPGQIELTAHSNVISRIARRLVRELDLRLVCVQLVDAAVCLTDVSKFIGAALVCTASMMRLGEWVLRSRRCRETRVCGASLSLTSSAVLCLDGRIAVRERAEQNGSFANQLWLR